MLGEKTHIPWLCILWVGLAFPCFGEDAILYGPEFTFTRPALILDAAIDYIRHRSNGGNMEHRKNRVAVPRLAAAVKRSCEGCTVEPVERVRYGKTLTHYRVTYPDGFWFELMPDPGVVEVTAKPQSLAQWKGHAERMQRDLFDAARRIGLRPSPTAGGGHLNIGAKEAFGDNGLLFRNFLVDMVNHPAMNSRGGKGAVPIHYLPEEKQETFRQIIADFDRGKMPTTKEALASRILNEVYPVGQSSRYVALALSYIPNKRGEKTLSPESQRLELRGVAAQNNMNEFLLQIEALEARVRHLAPLTEPIALVLPEGWTSGKDRRQQFQAWVQDSGLDPKRFESLPILPPRTVHIGNAIEYQAGRCLKALKRILH